MEKEIYFKEHVERENIKEVMYDTVEKYGDNIAFTIKNENKEYINKTYKDLLDDVNGFGTYLYEQGFKNGRIAVIGKNRYEWVVAHLANLLGGIVSIPLDKDLQYEELENSLIRSKADAIVYDPKLSELVEEIKKNEKTNLRKYISMDDVLDLTKEGKQKIIDGNEEFINNKIDKDKMNILLFTSGTTSQSKAVMLSHKNIASNVYSLQAVEDLRSTDTNIAFLPFHHIFGSTCMVFMLSEGVRTVFPDGLRYIKQNLKEYKVTVFVGVPVLTEAIYKAVLKEVEKQGKTKLIKIATAISNFLLKLHIDARRKIFKQILEGLGGKLRLVISGGAPADPLSIKGFNDMGITTLQGYGLSETAPVVAAENYKYRKAGSVGKPMICNEVEVVNKDENGIGEIRVKGPNVMLGYYEMEDVTNEVLKDGWFYTGDLGYIDKQGFIFITGRNKNMIVLKNGKKVFPEELETLVNRIDLVSECMVFGLPDEDNENDYTLSVKVVYDEETIKEKYSELSDEELEKVLWDKIKEVNTTFPKYKHIKNLIVSKKELIKTTTKKVKRQEEMKLILASRKD